VAPIETKVITAHVPQRSRGWIMKQALSAWIDQEEECNRLTREALADVDAGQVIDHQAVQAWADSFGLDEKRPVPP
jgi:predicted transcriptional regulator